MLIFIYLYFLYFTTSYLIFIYSHCSFCCLIFTYFSKTHVVHYLPRPFLIFLSFFFPYSLHLLDLIQFLFLYFLLPTFHFFLSFTRRSFFSFICLSSCLPLFQVSSSRLSLLSSILTVFCHLCFKFILSYLIHIDFLTLYFFVFLFTISSCILSFSLVISVYQSSLQVSLYGFTELLTSF